MTSYLASLFLEWYYTFFLGMTSLSSCSPPHHDCSWYSHVHHVVVINTCIFEQKEVERWEGAMLLVGHMCTVTMKGSLDVSTTLL
jgi:hypothetical protein